jgi:hypothetical protein
VRALRARGGRSPGGATSGAARPPLARPNTHLAPPAVSWNSTADTMLLSSSTTPQLVQIVSPVASKCSVSVPLHWGQWRVILATCAARVGVGPNREARWGPAGTSYGGTLPGRTGSERPERSSAAAHAGCGRMRTAAAAAAARCWGAAAGCSRRRTARNRPPAQAWQKESTGQLLRKRLAWCARVADVRREPDTGARDLHANGCGAPRPRYRGQCGRALTPPARFRLENRP